MSNPPNGAVPLVHRLPLFQGLLPFQWSEVTRNLIAGLTLAAMNIPQSLGYAKIAGMPVITGLYTLLLPLVAFFIFGSSRYLVVAADSATAVILLSGLSPLAAIASPRYVALASTAALLTGALLLLARLLKLGFLADFLSQTVLLGFLTGVGFQVGIAVLGEMLGINVHSRHTPVQFLEVLRSLRHVHLLTAEISLAVVVCIMVFRLLLPRLPGALFVVAGAIAASAIFHWSQSGVAVLGSVPAGLPHLGLPGLNWSDLKTLLPVAGSCFVMIITQSAATSRAYATRHHQQLNENDDLVGLAAANTTAAFSGTFVTNGSPTQTAMVESSGGTNQLAHLATAGVVAMVVLFLTGPLQFLPQCVLGAVVLTIAVRLIDFRGLRAIRRESPGEFALAVTTAVVVVFVGVEQGIVLAMALSLFRVVRHTYHPHTAVLEQPREGIWKLHAVVPGALTEPGLIIYRFGAQLFYANANLFSEEVRMLAASAPRPLHWFIVDAGAITHVDFTAARVLREVQKDLSKHGIGLVFAHVQSDFRPYLDRHHLTQAIGRSRIFDSLHQALAALRGTSP
jgi:sulfate permease, SulP family